MNNDGDILNKILLKLEEIDKRLVAIEQKVYSGPGYTSFSKKNTNSMIRHSNDQSFLKKDVIMRDHIFENSMEIC